MQSILQYRRLRRDLQQKIEKRGIKDTAGDPHFQHTGDFFNGVNDAALEDQLSHDPTSSPDVSSPVNGSPLQTVITLHNGQRVHVPGIDVQRARSIREEIQSETIFLVGFDDDDDPLNPKNWSLTRKWMSLGIVGTTGFLVGWAGAVDSAVIRQAKDDFGVSQVAESLATSLFLFAFGVGSLVAAPFSETLGRNPVYVSSLCLFMIFVMASGLAPNFGAQLAFRFLAGLFGCTPMTTFGGSMADMFDYLGRTYAFPICSSLSFLGPFLAPMVGALIGQSGASWRWVEWTSLIWAGLATVAIFLLVPETYGPVLLRWKAEHLRSITGDSRFKAEIELRGTSLLGRLAHNSMRPFQLFFGELMVTLFTLYLVVVYVVLFGFLTGYDYIFGQTYGFSQGSVGLTFLGMNVGFVLAFCLVPHIYGKYKRDLQSLGTGEGLPPEQRLWYALYGAPWLPISLFWMGWTNFQSISYWSGLGASVAFGFSVQGIFISSYQYLIDSYEVYAASALVSATLFRYLAAGALACVSIPMYENLGVRWSLTLLGCLSLLMTPVPYIFYRYGHIFRKRSKMAKMT